MIPLVFHPIYSQLDLPYRHRFPIEKYQGIYNELIAQGVCIDDFHLPAPLEPSYLSQVYDENYITELCTGHLDPKAMRRIGFPWSEQLIKRTFTAAAGTVLTAQLALEYGTALNLTGGYHHAFADFGSGFCMINDLYLAARSMLNKPGIDSVLIFDCDVHQGDGTAKLAQNDNDIFTVSLHGEKNFPHRKQISDMDIGFAKGTGDAEYLDVVDSALHLAFIQCQPDAVIYDAGVDIHIDDDLGHLAITTAGVLARDQMVYAKCAAAGVPVAAVIGGGYQRDIDALVDVHMQLFHAFGVVQSK